MEIIDDGGNEAMKLVIHLMIQEQEGDMMMGCMLPVSDRYISIINPIIRNEKDQ
ncbi:MAG: hypothetical protein ACI8RD_009079 [Bacillariaceae sp.]|jgi:hypothetical protein